MKNKGLANKAAQNRLPGFRVLSQFFLQSISHCAILLYTGHKKHPVFLHRIVFFYRCDPRPSRGLQLGIVLKVNCNLLDATRAPHGDCNTIACLIFRCVSTRCDPRPSRGLQLQSIVDKSFVLNRCDPRPSRGQKKNGMPGGRHTVFVFCDVKKVECEHHVGLHQMT